MDYDAWRRNRINIFQRWRKRETAEHCEKFSALIPAILEAIRKSAPELHSDDGRMLSLYLLTSPHANMTGCFRLPDGYVCEDLQWDKNRVSEGFEELSRNGFAIRDKATRWVLIPGYLEWNGFENPNVAIAALKLFRDVPDKIAIKSLLADGMRQAISRFEPGKLNGFERVLEGFQTVVGTPEPESPRTI